MIYDLALRVAVALGISSAFALGATAEEPRRLKRKVESSAETVIGIGARWSKACEGIEPPRISLDQSPEHGFVCIRTATVKPRGILFGDARQCIDVPMRGVQLIYRSRVQFSGPDRVGYTMAFPRGTRQFVVDIEVAPRETSTKDSNAPYERQPTGPVPECAALMS